MKKDKIEKYYILGLVIFIILSILIIQSLIVFSTEQLKKPVGKKETTTTVSEPKAVEVVEEPIGACPGSGAEVGMNEMLGADRFDATAGGREGTFCSQNGTPFYHESKTGAATTDLGSIQEIVARGAIKGSAGYVKGQAALNPYSFPQLYCEAHDVDLSQSAPDIAFAVASGASQDDIQQAVWGRGTGRELDTPQGSVPLGNDNPVDLSTLSPDQLQLIDQSGDYSDFKDIKDSYQMPDQNMSLNITVNTDEALVQVDYDKQILIVGPIYIDYPSGGDFGGLSDMYFEGINSQGNSVKGQERIEINNYGSDPDKIDQELNFFDPSKEIIEGTTNNKTLMDTSEDKSYPASGKGFYVTINNPNQGISGSFSTSETITMKEHLKISTVTKLKMHYAYQWMEVTSVKGCNVGAYVEHLFWTTPTKTGALICGHHDWSCYDEDDELDCGHYHSASCDEWTATPYTKREEVQKHLVITKIVKTLYEQEIIVEIEIPIDIEIDVEVNMNININVNVEGGGENTMMIGGKVWEDTLQGKDNKANGIKDDNDKVLPNVKVTLYEVEKGKETEKPGKIAPLLLSKVGTTKENVMNTINPTYTNEDGEYLFIGVNPLKKYYVEFEYNGQTYLPTEYGRDTSTYNSESWQMTSKGTETPSERNTYNTRFAEIGSSPANYASTNNLGWAEGGYNEAFSQYDLMGFELDSEGRYRQATRLIDSYYKINENGDIIETSEFQEGEISKAIHQYIQENLETPDENAMKKIYEGIAGNNPKLKRMLQFVEDTKIHSYTQQQDAQNYDLYPIYNQFTLNVKSSPLPAGFYPGIYGGQLYINQGLVKRENVDLALRKDVLYAATRINGKTEVYSYDKRANNQEYWQIQLRMRDYNNYYSGNYTKDLYEADYYYRSENTNKAGSDKDLQLYVTYKITVKNTSESIIGEITELVDYYDKDYTYRDDLSWVMYKKSSNSNDLNEISFTKEDYYNTIKQLSLQGNIDSQNKGTKSATSGRYETRSSKCKSDMTKNYDDIYINGLEGKQLASGEEAYVYLTFEVKKTDSKIITDTDDSLKQNYVEINGYKTYYKDGTILPNNIEKGSKDAAGLIDINSTPGNLCMEDLQKVENNRFEHNLENDTDHAKGVKVVVREDFIRSLNGTVWEDQRLYNVSNTKAMIGDGIRQDAEVGINGVTVELVERLDNGNEYVWQETVSGSGKGRRRNIETGQWEDYNYEFIENGLGRYEFVKSITGNYYIRFKYGDTALTANTSELANEDGVIGQNKTSYNGQDFKSTIYQKDMNNGTEIKNYTGMTIEGYDGKYQGTDVGYYEMRELDNLNKNGSHFSDAKDIWNRRQEVIQYSNSNITNSVAEELASPYTTGNTKELIKQTQMVAVTGLIILEGEYNRTGTDGYANTNNGSEFYNNAQNGKYTVNDVDFGLAERPKAGLELGKTITNVKVTLANGNILFDANTAATDLLWNKGEAYELNQIGMENNKYQEFYGLNNHRYAYRTKKGKMPYSVNELVESKYKNLGNNGLIVATMDEELMQGANITISYLLTVTNIGETDYEGQDYYYKGIGASQDNMVTTSADIVTDYVANNLSFNTTNNEDTGWKITDNVITTLGLNHSLATQVAKFNNVIHTQNLAKKLLPEENTTVGLVLTQLINPEDSADNKTYNNIAEITTISNTVGRRMAYSIQGNQDPTNIPTEVDSVKSERVTILPPFGIGNIIVYLAIIAITLGLLVIGVIFIKKSVTKT